MNENLKIFSHPDYGSVYIIGKKKVKAGSFGTWEFVYTVGKKSIPARGRIEIVFNTSYPTNTWSIPQTYDKTAPGYVRALLSGAGRLSVRVLSVPEKLQSYSLGCHIIQCILEEATLFERDSIRIIYGDTSYGSRGAQAQFMAREVEFPVYVDAKGKNNKILNKASWFRVICRLAPVRKVAKKYNLLLIPHHTGYSSENLRLTSWDIFKEEFTPVVEIYSTHGCSEYYNNPRALVNQNPGSFYQDALKKGYKLGAMASSDYHQAFLGQDIKLQEHPGNLNCRHFQYRTGYTAVITKELSRKAIFNALRSRHCYATTGERIYLNFQINGQPMGSDLKITSPEKVNILIEVAGTNKFEKIEILKNNHIFYSCNPKEKMIKFLQCTDEKLNEGTSYYYVRVRQVDGEMAWSSPIWVTKEKW